MKDFHKWNRIKNKLDRIKNLKFFRERDIWWCHIGLNIGHEEDGKGSGLIRPILIIKKHNKDCFLGISLSSKIKNNKYYFDFETSKKRYSVILSQIRLFSSKRLVTKIDKVDNGVFIKIKRKITHLNFE